MTIVDKKGRLFGWINLLDLVIILAIVAVAGRFGYKALAKQKAVAEGQSEKIRVTFIIDNVRPASLEGIKPGMDVQDRKSLAMLGTVVDVQTQKTVVQGAASEYESASRVNVLITVEGNGRITKNGSSLNGIEMKVGLPVSLGTPEWAGSGYVWVVPKTPQSSQQ